MGRARFVEFMKGWEELFESWSFEVEEAIDVGDGRVVVFLRQEATGRGSGAHVEMHYGSLYELENGRIARISNFLEPNEALQAAGMSARPD